VRKPQLNAGPYADARAGVGDFVGFNSAWSDWTSAFLGNVADAVAIFGAFSYFVPAFGNGNIVISVIGGPSPRWQSCRPTCSPALRICREITASIAGKAAILPVIPAQAGTRLPPGSPLVLPRLRLNRLIRRKPLCVEAGLSGESFERAANRRNNDIRLAIPDLPTVPRLADLIRCSGQPA
jgi:hypothetical protein